MKLSFSHPDVDQLNLSGRWHVLELHERHVGRTRLELESAEVHVGSRARDD